MKFIDEVAVTASSGAGGDGAVMFRREKFVPKGGPSGGDGGRGGDIRFQASSALNTLHRLRFRPIIKAKRGGHGGRANMHGRGAEHTVIDVPIGTVIKDVQGRVLADLDAEGEVWIALPGGRGGKGNARFTSSTNRAPTRSEAGELGQTKRFCLELKLLADVGLLGFPNAGKSTFIARVSAARPKIAAYPFTTLEPSLGVVQVPGGWNTFVIADIPGLVGGAAEGVGLGHQFLRHVERCSVLLHLLSLDPLEDEVNGDPVQRFDAINHELASYDPVLAERPQLVLLSKLDLASPERLDELRSCFKSRGYEVLAASAVTGEGIDPVLFRLADLVREERSSSD